MGGGYTQTDVTNFAQILSGWSIGGGRGRFAAGDTGRFYFRAPLHEPGAQRLLGKTYAQDGLAQGEAVLRDLAQHPATAHFLATKLVRQFVADDPPAAAVARVAHAFTRSAGHLPTTYAALVDSPEAWDPAPRKLKTPEDFVFSALRALDALPTDPQTVIGGLDAQGQRPYTPGSPAGWPDTAANWGGADALMHRIQWASHLAATHERGVDPEQVAVASLGRYASQTTLDAVRRAAYPAQGLTLLLMSPEFQYR